MTRRRRHHKKDSYDTSLYVPNPTLLTFMGASQPAPEAKRVTFDEMNGLSDDKLANIMNILDEYRKEIDTLKAQINNTLPAGITTPTSVPVVTKDYVDDRIRDAIATISPATGVTKADFDTSITNMTDQIDAHKTWITNNTTSINEITDDIEAIKDDIAEIKKEIKKNNKTVPTGGINDNIQLLLGGTWY